MIIHCLYIEVTHQFARDRNRAMHGRCNIYTLQVYLGNVFRSLHSENLRQGQQSPSSVGCYIRLIDAKRSQSFSGMGCQPVTASLKTSLIGGVTSNLYFPPVTGILEHPIWFRTASLWGSRPTPAMQAAAQCAKQGPSSSKIRRHLWCLAFAWVQWGNFHQKVQILFERQKRLERIGACLEWSPR